MQTTLSGLKLVFVMLPPLIAVIPVHASERFLESVPDQGVAVSNLMKLTMSNMTPSSSVLW
jgi:hypothetical protein